MVYTIYIKHEQSDEEIQDEKGQGTRGPDTCEISHSDD